MIFNTYSTSYGVHCTVVSRLFSANNMLNLFFSQFFYLFLRYFLLSSIFIRDDNFI